MDANVVVYILLAAIMPLTAVCALGVLNTGGAIQRMPDRNTSILGQRPVFLIKSFLMRLTDQERAAITETIMSFDQDARLYLFGSRVDDNRKGGDIDLLVLTDKLTFADKLKIKARLWERLGEQKIDLVMTDDESRPFVRIALEDAIRL